MARRYYSSTAVETTLSGSISNSATSITVTALSGFPNTTPWTAIIDADTASEELVEVTNVAGTTLTVTRGVDGTAAVSHNAGASFRHGVSARDFDEANDHVNDSTGVHGLGASSSVVGTTDTQTLTNKTISGASNTISNIAQSSVTNLTTDLGNKANVSNPTFTGVAQFPDGSASAPSITNTGDTNTGLFYPAEDTVAITTGGTERLRFDSGGIISSTSSAVGRPRLTLSNTNTDASGVELRMTKMPSDNSISANDGIADITFRASDSGGTERTAAYFQAKAVSQGATFVEGRVSIWNTNSSGTTDERFRIDGNGLITGTGTSLGAWTAYTPALTAATTNPTLGTGSTASGGYCQIGKTVHFRARVEFGTSGTNAGSGDYYISIPVNAFSGYPASFPIGRVVIQDQSTGTRYNGLAVISTASTVRLDMSSTNANSVAAASGSPMAFDASDDIWVSGTYEIA